MAMATARLRAIARHTIASAAAGDAATALADVEYSRTVGEEEEALLAIAEKVFPGGSTGNTRAGGPVIVDGKGPYLWDKSGNKYIDLACGSGPMFLGHSHPAVVRPTPPHLAPSAALTSFVTLCR